MSFSSLREAETTTVSSYFCGSSGLGSGFGSGFGAGCGGCAGVVGCWARRHAGVAAPDSAAASAKQHTAFIRDLLRPAGG